MAPLLSPLTAPPLVTADSPEARPDLADLPYDLFPSPDDYTRERRRLDLYLPATQATGAGHPLLLWFHGGGLETGDKNGPGERVFARRMAGAGVIVALANYRLSPRATYPAYLDDAARAVAWTVAHARAHGAAPARLHVGGESAGAYLAAMLAMDPRHLAAVGVHQDQIAGYLPVSGQMTTHFTVKKERGGWDGQSIQADSAAPIYFTRQNIRPMRLLLAERELPARIEENRFFAAALREIGQNPRVDCHLIPDRDHGSIGANVFAPGDLAGHLLLEFVNIQAK